jgi:UDP-glucose 4-epimerase
MYFLDQPFMVWTPSHAELDLTDSKKVKDYMEDINPDVVIHTAMEGTGKLTDTYENFLNNMKMFDNLLANDRPGRTTFLFGSGAEFDRSKAIKKVSENEGLLRWPYDFYGLAKSIQTRRMYEFQDAFTLRLFGCFGPYEDNTRFIKRAILNTLAEEPIEIHQDREMDFFYVEDVGRTITHILKHGCMNRNINLVYQTKHTLKYIAKDVASFFEYSKIAVNKKGMADSYSGKGDRLSGMQVPLLGLHRGINEMVSQLVMAK